LIIAVNSRPSTLFLLVRGSVVIEVQRGTPIARLSPGDIFGEMAFVEETVASASVVAEVETEVDAIELDDIKEMFGQYPHLATRFHKSIGLMLSRRLRQTSAQLARTKVKT
jgi:CRP-like cAMP-binding protein